MAERPAPDPDSLRVWLVAVLGAAVAGVLIALGVWAAWHPADADGSSAPDPATISWPHRSSPTTTSAASGGSAPETGAGVPSGPSVVAAGTCLAPASGSDATITPADCAGDHTLEVVGTVDVSDDFSTRPTDDEWRVLLGRRCPELLRAYLDDRHDPNGLLRLRIAAPDDAEWAAGDHTGECLAYVATSADAQPAVVRGSVREIEQAPPIRPGDCLQLTGVAGLAPVSVACDAPHELEVLGPLELGERFEHAPSSAQWTELHGDCQGQLTAAFGDGASAPLSVPGNRLAALAVPIPIESWLAGRRTAVCAVAEVDAAGALVQRRAALAD